MMTQTIYHKRIDRRLQREATAVMSIPFILIAIVVTVAFIITFTSSGIECPAKEKTPIEKGKHLNEENDDGRKHEGTDPDLNNPNSV